MLAQLKLLYELQQADSGLARCRAQLSALDDGRQVARDLEAAQTELQRLQKRLHDLETENRQKELELKSADEEYKEKMSKAYGGMIADAKELAALERKIEELARKRDRLADEILALMDEIESTRQKVAQQEKIVAQAQGIYDKIVADYKIARANLESEIERHAARRKELVAEIEPSLLQEYENLRAKLEGVAVSSIEDNLCTACRNVLPQSAITTAKMGKTIVKCQNCRRILYYPS